MTYFAQKANAIGARTMILKTPGEIARMAEAGRINAAALHAVGEAVRPGITTAELDRIAEDVIRKAGARPAFLGYPGPYPYPATLNTSLNEQLVHGIPGSTRLRSGDILSIDCGTYYKGFYADSAVTYAVGKIKPIAKRLLTTTQRALDAGIAQLQPGNRLGDVSAAIQAVAEGQGFHLTRKYTGHGIGQNMHEAPEVMNVGTAGKGAEIRAGLVVALEPMVLIGTEETKVLSDQWTVASRDGSLTAHFEHTVAVTQDGPLILTKMLDG